MLVKLTHGEQCISFSTLKFKMQNQQKIYLIPILLIFKIKIGQHRNLSNVNKNTLTTEHKQ
jgi:hypothetical protein